MVSIYEYEIPTYSSNGYGIAVLHDLNNNFDTNRTGDPGEPLAWYRMGVVDNLDYTDDSANATRVFSGASISVNFNPPPTGPVDDVFEPDNNTNDAKYISIGTSENHNLTENDEDWHWFDMIAGVNYRIETFASTGDDTDTVLEVFENDGVTLIGENDDISTMNYFSQVNFMAPSTSLGYLRVTGFEGGVGDYGVGYYSEGVTAGVITPETAQYDSISQGEFTWYSFSADAGVTYTIWTYAAGGPDADTVVAVLSDTFAELAENNDGPVSPFSEVVFTPATSGTYYIRVRSLNDGEYNLQYTAPTSIDVTIQ
jgi:hypothetical protein